MQLLWLKCLNPQKMPSLVFQFNAWKDCLVTDTYGDIVLDIANILELVEYFGLYYFHRNLITREHCSRVEITALPISYICYQVYCPASRRFITASARQPCARIQGSKWLLRGILLHEWSMNPIPSWSLRSSNAGKWLMLSLLNRQWWSCENSFQVQLIEGLVRQTFLGWHSFSG